MTSALRGEGGTFKSRHSNQPSKGGYVFLWTRGKGVKKSENFADVIYGSPVYNMLGSGFYGRAINSRSKLDTVRLSVQSAHVNVHRTLAPVGSCNPYVTVRVVQAAAR